MSNAADERIVEMQFDNEDFEKDVSKTMGTLDKLKKSLSFENVKDGFSRIQNGIAGTNFGPIEEGLYRIKDGFGMVEMLGLQAMSRISNAVLDTGQKLASALTIDPIKSGLQEYETQIGAVQTIMANTEAAFKGVSEQEHLDEVNATLDELNTYADKTIYNFTEMTRNIGTFTAAGVSLKDSKVAIQGIANAAAVSGSTSQQASNAMYQLSQALAAGSVKLQDWNSVVSAGMGGEVFQNALIQSSKALAVANEKVQQYAKSEMKAEEIAEKTGLSVERVSSLLENEYSNSYDIAIAKHGTFRETLTEGWITSDVLIDALRNFTLNLDDMSEEEQEAARAMLETNGYTKEQIEDIFRLGKTATEAATKVKTFTQLIDTTKEALQSGWTQSWEYIIGDFGEAKSLWTDISNYLNDAITKSAESRNTILQQWHDGGGRDNLIEGLKLSFQGLVSYATVAKNEVFSRFIPEVTVKTLNDFSNALLAIGKKIQPTSEQLESFRAKLELFVKPLELVKTFIFALKHRLGTISESIKKVGGVFGDIIDKIGIFIGFVSRVAKAARIPKLFADTVADAFKTIGNVTETVYEKVGEFLKALTGLDIDFFKLENGNWRTVGNTIRDTMDGIAEKVSNAKAKVAEFGDTIATFIKDLTGFDIKKFFTWENFISGVTKFRERIASLPETFTSFKDSAKAGFGQFVTDFNTFTGLNLHMPTWEEFKNTLQSIVDTVKQWKTNFETTSAAIGAFFTGIWEKLEPVRQKFNDAKEAVKGFFASFKKDGESEEGITVLERLSKAATFVGDTFAKIFGKVAEVLGNLWDKLKELKDKIDFQSIFAGIIGGASGLGLLNLVSLLGNLNKAISGEGVLDFFKQIERTFGHLTDKLKDAAEVLEDVLEPFGDTLAAFQNKLKADMLKNIALAVAILVGSIVVISLVDPEKLKTGISAIAALMLELVAAVKAFTDNNGGGKGGDFAKVAVGIIELSASLLIMSAAVANLARLDPEQLFGGLAGVGALIVMLYAFVENFNKMQNFDAKGFSKTAKAMIALAVGVWLLSSSVKRLGELNLGALVKGLIGVGAILGALGLFTKFAEAEKMGIRSGIGLVLLATAIGMLASAVTKFADFGWEAIAKGLVAVGVILGALGLFTRFSDAEKMGIRSGLGIMAIAQAIRMLADATLLFVDLNIDQINNGLYAVAMILGTLGLFTKFSDANKMGVLSGVGIILLAQGVSMLANVAKEFVDMDVEQLVKGLGSLGIIMAMLALTGNALVGTAGAGVAMILMATALNMLIIPMKALGAMEWESIAKGLAAIGGVFVILGAAGYLLSPVVPVILGLAGALMLMGAAAALAGAGAVAMASAVTVVENFAAILNGINMEVMLHFFKDLVATIIGMVPVFVIAVSKIVGAILMAIAQNGVQLISTVTVLGLAVLKAIQNLVPALIETGIMLLKALLTGINENIYDIIILGASILINFINGMAVVAPALVEAGVNLIISLMNGMSQAIINNADRLVDAMQNVFWSIIYAVIALIQGALENIPVIGDKISGGLEKVKEDVKSKINYEEGKAVTNDLMDGAAAGVEEKTPQVREKVDELAGSVNEGLENVDGEPIGESIGSGIVSGVAASEGEAGAVGGLLGTGITNAIGGADGEGASSELLGKITGGLESGQTDITDISNLLGQSGVDAFAGVDGENGGSELMEKLGIGMTNNQSAVEGAAQDAGESAAGDSGIRGTIPLFEDSGRDIMTGAANGIAENDGAVQSAAWNAGIKALNSFNSATGVASPSWKFAESGRFQMVGAAQGIAKNMGLLIGAAKYAGNETVDAFADSISDLGSTAELGIDDTPSIRPVMDLSGIQNGIQNMKTLMGGVDYTPYVTPNVSVGQIDVGSAVGELSAATTRGNSDLLSQLQLQARQTERLIYLLENQKLYLYPDTMVGKLGPKLNNYLGKQAALAGRRRN